MPWLLALPRWAKGLGLIALGIAAFLIWDWFDDRAAVRKHDAAIVEAIATASASASASASETVAETKAGVEQGNQRARDAAAKSSDPLRDGLGALRK